MRRSYPAQVVVNGRLFRRVVIDSHYEKKHRNSVNDSIVLGLVQALDGKELFRKLLIRWVSNILH